MLEGLCARNRALQGDVVVVEVLEEVSAANVRGGGGGREGGRRRRIHTLIFIFVR